MELLENIYLIQIVFSFLKKVLLFRGKECIYLIQRPWLFGSSRIYFFISKNLIKPIFRKVEYIFKYN